MVVNGDSSGEFKAHKSTSWPCRVKRDKDKRKRDDQRLKNSNEKRVLEENEESEGAKEKSDQICERPPETMMAVAHGDKVFRAWPFIAMVTQPANCDTRRPPYGTLLVLL